MNPFLAAVSVILMAWYAYLGRGLIAAEGAWAAGLWTALALPYGFVAWVPFVYWRRDEPKPYPRMLAAAFLSVGALSFLFLACAARDLLWLALRQDSLRGAPASFVLLLGAAAMMALAFVEATRVPRVSEVTVKFEGLAPELEGLRIVQLSDLHIDPTVPASFIESVVERANALNPDVIALTGDFVDGTVLQLRDAFARLGRLKARDGVFYVTGNHEYYWGADEWVQEAKRIGLTPLHNEHRVLERGGAKLVLAGVPDLWAGKGVSDPARALDGAPAAVPRILLAHQPRSIFKAAEAGFDLQLSGHTHGGQFIPWTFFVGFFQPYSRGLKRHGKTWIYVSRGTGTWGPPMRLGSRSEITLVRLARG